MFDPSQEILNLSFEYDVNEDEIPDFWTTIIPLPPGGSQIIKKRDIITAPDGLYFMEVINTCCIPGQGGQTIFFANKEIANYNVNFEYYAPDSTTFEFRIIDAETDTVIVNEQISAIPSWNQFSTMFFNPSFSFAPRRMKLQFLPAEGDCIHRFFIDKVEVAEPIITGLEDTNPKAFDVRLSAVPNPFNPVTNIIYEIPEPGMISIRIYNVIGRCVKKLYKGQSSAGRNKVIWDGKDGNGQMLVSGVYFAKMKSKFGNRTFKLILLK
jgi:hypothetical protein